MLHKEEQAAVGMEEAIVKSVVYSHELTPTRLYSTFNSDSNNKLIF